MRNRIFAVAWVLNLSALLHPHAAAQRVDGVGPTDFVNVEAVVPGIVVDIRYATATNFLKRQVYPANKCYLRRPVAERLAKVQADLRKDGLGLKVWDGYRPLSVQRAMWKLKPDNRYVANPANGSQHNRGAAVDVTLVDGAGRELEMPTRFDDFSEKAHVDYKGVTKVATANRERLQSVMKRHGFRSLATEWWHFSAPAVEVYPMADVSFAEIEAEIVKKEGKQVVPKANETCDLQK